MGRKTQDDATIEQRTNLKFLVRLGKSCSECYDMLKVVYGPETLSRSRVYQWYWRFSNGHTTVWNRKQTGRPNTAMNKENLERVRKLLEDHKQQFMPCPSIRKVARTLNIDKETARKLIDVLKKPVEPLEPIEAIDSIEPIETPKLFSPASSQTSNVEVQDTCIVVSFTPESMLSKGYRTTDEESDEEDQVFQIPEPPDPIPARIVLPPISGNASLYYARKSKESQKA